MIELYCCLPNKEGSWVFKVLLQRFCKTLYIQTCVPSTLYNHIPLIPPPPPPGASAQVDSCASLLDAISDTACFCNNATSLTCPLGDRTGSPEAVTFTVEPCADPVYVLVTVRVSEEFTSQQTFVSDGEVYLVDGSSLSVRIARNVTHLDFEVCVCV